MRKIYAFTLVELLVVIAIISTLAAMLLPTLSDALEQGRRVACAGNQKQLYLGAACYAGDFNDRLPYRMSMGILLDSYTFLYYTSSPAEPVRRYLDMYMGIPTVGTTRVFTSRDNVMYCPSMKTPSTGAYHTDWTNRPGYMLRAFGIYRNGMCLGQDLGTTRFSIVGQAGKLGPKVFIQDFIYYSKTDNYYGNNHALQGANVVAGDGSGRWNGREEFSGTSDCPKRYYAQAYQLWTPTYDGSNTRFGQNAVSYPPNGVSYGWNHQPEYYTPNRRLFGYR